MARDLDLTVRVRMKFLPVMMPYEAGIEFCDLLFGPDRLMPCVREGNELRKRLPDDGSLSEYLTQNYLRVNKSRVTLGISAKQIFSWYARLGCRVWTEVQPERGWGRPLQIEVPLEHWLDNDFYPDLVAAAEVGNAALTEVEFRDPVTETYPIRDLDELAAAAAAASLSHLTSPAFGPWRGLVGIPWRTLLSNAFVDTLGAERLRRLPADLAVEHSNGLWTLQISELPQDSHSEQAAENEQTIIETLGQEFFINRATLAIPTVTPNFPPEFWPQD